MRGKEPGYEASVLSKSSWFATCTDVSSFPGSCAEERAGVGG